MGKPFKLSIISDFKDLLKGADNAADSLESIGDTLDAVAKDSDRATDRLERDFTTAFRAVKKSSKTTGDAIGDDLHRGTREAGKGLDELKDESASTAREAAASFDGSAESIADAFQEVAANAFAGFGPAGAAAGLAVALGLGMALSALQDLADKEAEAKEATIDLAREIGDVGGNPAAIDWATRLRDRLYEITDKKEWWEFWQNTPKTRLEEWSSKARQFGVSMADVARGIAGDQAGLDRAMETLNRKIEEQRRLLQDVHGDDEQRDRQRRAIYGQIAGLEQFRDAISREADTAAGAAGLNQELTDAISGMSDAVHDSAQATEEYQSKVAEALDSAGESWQKYVQDGVVNLGAYNDAIAAQAAAVQGFEANLVTASKLMSDEALGYLRAMGPEAAPLLDAFLNAPLAQQQRTAANWDMLGRASTDGYRQGLALDQAVGAAAQAAQNTANANPVKVPTWLDASGLNVAVRNAVQNAQNAAPPIVIRVTTQPTTVP